MSCKSICLKLMLIGLVGMIRSQQAWSRPYGKRLLPCDLMGITALHRAAYDEDLTAIHRLVVDEGADVNQRNIFDQTPLHWAADGKSLEAFKLLLSLGATRNEDRFDKTPKTPLPSPRR